MSTYKELLELQQQIARQAAEISKQLEDARRAERAGVIQQIRDMMAEHGLTVADLGNERGSRRGSTKPASGGNKVAAKFRHPETGETWSGRGLKPKWLQVAIAGGQSLEEFRI